MKRTQQIMLLCMALTALPLSAAAQKLTVSVQQAADHAVENNRQSRNASLAVQEAKAKQWEAIANGLPQAEATADYTNFLGASVEAFGNTIEFNPTTNVAFRVTQLVFSGNYYVGLRMAKIARSMAQTGKTKSDLELRIDVANAYYLALVAVQSRVFAAQNLANLQSIYETTKLSAQVGVIEQTDLDQLTVQVNSMANAVRSAERQIELAHNMLRLQMGVSATTELELTDNLEAIIAHTNVEAATERLFEVEKNIDYRLMTEQETLAQQQIRLQQAAALPTLAAYYSYTEKLKKPAIDFSPSQMVGLNLTVPIFSSGLRCARVKQARIQYETTLNQKELLTDQLRIQEKQARFNLRNATDQYLTQQQNLEVSQRVFNNINLKFQQGLVSGIDLTTAANNHVNAQNSYVMAVLQLLQAGNDLEKLYFTTEQ